MSSLHSRQSSVLSKYSSNLSLPIFNIIPISSFIHSIFTYTPLFISCITYLLFLTETLCIFLIPPCPLYLLYSIFNKLSHSQSRLYYFLPFFSSSCSISCILPFIFFFFISSLPPSIPSFVTPFLVYFPFSLPISHLLNPPPFIISTPLHLSSIKPS